MSTAAPHALADVTASDSTLRRFLHGLPGVDPVGLEARAASLGTRSIKTTAKAYAIDLAISMVDLTTLEGADTPGKVRSLGAKAVLPDPTDRTTPATAAVCVYPDMVPTAKAAVAGSTVKVASVATAFPAYRAALSVKLADVHEAVSMRRRRDRHGHRPRRVPLGALPQGPRRDHRRKGSLRLHGPAEGHLRDR